MHADATLTTPKVTFSSQSMPSSENSRQKFIHTTVTLEQIIHRQQLGPRVLKLPCCSVAVVQIKQFLQQCPKIPIFQLTNSILNPSSAALTRQFKTLICTATVDFIIITFIALYFLGYSLIHIGNKTVARIDILPKGLSSSRILVLRISNFVLSGSSLKHSSFSKEVKGRCLLSWSVSFIIAWRENFSAIM